ncbi:MAG: NAD(P)-dependent oxidoreductase, partial [Chloroflexi bacterium]|nr:NAD(P)-dependent oxidoreductase [Chloroflexota bacterium]
HTRTDSVANQKGATRMNVGLVGVGTMGSRIAKAVIDGGHHLVARDIDPKAEALARELGAEVVSSPKAVAQKAEVILLSLPLPKDVAEVLLREGDGLLAGTKAGQVIVDMSTVDPISTQHNYEIAMKQGVGYLDAPVLGRPQGIGKWTLPVGGDAEPLRKAQPILNLLAKKADRVGPSGWGDLIKVLNNMMFAAINSITVEIMALASKMGMDPKVLYETIANSGAASVSNLFVELGPKILERDFDPRFTVDLLHKDVSLGIDMAKAVKAPLFIAPACQLLNEMGRAKGVGDRDTSILVNIYEEYLGVTVQPGEGGQ